MPDKGVQVLDRAFDILELIAAEKNGFGVTEISVRLGLNKTTVHRILSALSSRGYAEKIPGSNNYGAGLRLVETSSLRLNNIELKTEAKPYLWDLANKMQQPVHLAILDGTDAVYIDKVDTISNIRLYSQIGKRIPCYCSGLGKALLIERTDDEITRLLEGRGFFTLTPNTLKDMKGYLADVRKARKNGYATDDEEHDIDIRCIAAPIYDYRKKIIAAISASGSSSAFKPENDHENGRIVIETALSISKRLGYII